MIHFDIDERYLDEAAVGTAISRRESVILAVMFHVLMGALIMFGPRLPLFQPSADAQKRAQELRMQEQARAKENRTFVFVKPKLDLKATKPPERGEASDADRIARAPQIAPQPTNPLPYSRGNTTERVEESAAAQASGTPQSAPEAVIAEQTTSSLPRLQQSETGYVRGRDTPRPNRGGPLGEALKNLQRYVQRGSLENPGGGAAQQPGAAIQFDTKGVEFGPWIRRFVAQVKRNWFVPNAAMLMKGHVVLQFNIHKDGRISEIAVVGPSSVEAFNNAAYNAILTSNPTEPLPPEYPDEQTLFTVTFYYNEEPPSSN